MTRLPALALLAMLAAPPAAAQKALTGQTAVTFFVEAQDLPVLSPEQLAERARQIGDEPEAVAADASLNGWKQCVQEALVHWAPLGQGPGVLVDGAWGRCADLARDYRGHLVRMTPGGRQVIDTQLARNLTRSLEEAWRPRLVAQALDQTLAARPATPPAGAALPAREALPKTREERLPATGGERHPPAALPRGAR